MYARESIPVLEVGTDRRYALEPSRARTSGALLEHPPNFRPSLCWHGYAGSVGKHKAFWPYRLHVIAVNDITSMHTNEPRW